MARMRLIKEAIAELKAKDPDAAITVCPAPYG